MSHRAIAVSLTLTGLSTGERLVVFSLASFANREQRAWPGTRVAAARAGLSKSQYLAGLRVLQDRGLVEIEEPGGGRARSALVRLAFVEDRLTAEVEVNARLFEAVLSAGSVKGSGRVLLAVLAALADGDGVVAGVSVEELCEAAGLSERTYRRVRVELLRTAMVELLEPGGGRGRANQWRVGDPSNSAGTSARPSPQRPQVPAGARPLMTPLSPPRPDAEPFGRGAPVSALSAAGSNPGQIRTVSEVNPGQSRIVSAENPGQIRTDSPQTPADTPAQTPAPYAHAGREPLNQRTSPPDPPKGGRTDSISISETYLSPTGRRRTRTVALDRSAAGQQLTRPDDQTLEFWWQVRALLRQTVGADRFDVWLADLRPVAIAAEDRALLLDGPPQVRTWVAQRYGALLADASAPLGLLVRIVSDRDLAVLTALEDSAIAQGRGAGHAVPLTVSNDKEAV